MPSLICLVQRLSLGDSSRSVVKEGEQFEVDAATAETYINGGIAKLVEAPQKPKEAPKQLEPVPEPEPEKTEMSADDALPPETPEVTPQKHGKRSRR